MKSVLVLWLASAAATVGLYLLFSLAIDRKVSLSTWVRLGLAVMATLGPLGTVLTADFLVRVTRDMLQARSRSARAGGTAALPLRMEPHGKASLYPASEVVPTGPSPISCSHWTPEESLGWCVHVGLREGIENTCR